MSVVPNVFVLVTLCILIVYSSSNNCNPGSPLFLTPLIESHQILEAQAASKVRPMKGTIISYAGYFTVNKTYNSNLFFWFFPAIHSPDTAPVMLWLQGGPGASSLFGLFTGNGPFYVTDEHTLELRKLTWVSSHSIIYIDSPVGVGYSFTDNPNGYCTNEVEVGLDLYSALLQFFTLFPQYQTNDFFVSGESYAGKYVPAVANTIHQNNPSANLKINLQGLTIGNGYCDPENMMHYGDFLYQIGLLDSNGRDVFHVKEEEIVSAIQQKQWKNAFHKFDRLMTLKTSTFQDLTGFTYYYNYLYDHREPHPAWIQFVKKVYTRRHLHVGNTTYLPFSIPVQKYLVEDVMQSARPTIETLLEHYRVLIYSGQLDIIVAAPLTQVALDALNWSGAQDYKQAARKFWYVGKELAGYAKVGRNLIFVLMRNAGHLVPTDQPLWSIDLITRFTRNITF